MGTFNLVVSALVLFPTLASAQLLEIRQTIFGMDCAPCARSVELALKKIDGVRSVKMSLNNGLAEIKLAPFNSTAIHEVQSVIRHNGFTAKEAEVLVKGALVEQDNQFVLKTVSESYTLIQQEEFKESFALLQRSRSGTEVTVRGVIAESKDSDNAPRTLRVREVIL